VRPRLSHQGHLNQESVERWIRALGGLGIIGGPYVQAYYIFSAIGSKLTNLIPSRGLSIEFGAAITIIIGSRIGLSVSTTHRQVGATMSVGLVELKTSTVN
jgi:phosphate/sulfate permease